jgi:DUF1365 family protein
VAEVNNTFGERHCYLLDRTRRYGWGRECAADKVFHVSPFCRGRSGRYRFRFMRTERQARAGRRRGGARRPRRRRTARCCRPASAAHLRAADAATARGAPSGPCR